MYFFIWLELMLTLIVIYSITAIAYFLTDKT